MDYLKEESLFYEKRAARSTGNKIGFGIIIFSILSYIATMVLLVVVFLVPGVRSYLNDPVVNYLYSAAITVPGFIIGGILIIKMQRRKIKEIVLFKKPKKPIIPLIFIGMGICMVGNVITSIFATYLEKFFNFTPKMPELDTPTDPIGIAVYLICATVLPAITEEFLYRGAVFGSLKKFGKPIAIILSAMLFGIMHGNLIQIPFAFVVGLVLGFVTAESDSIWPAVIIHFLNNFFACMFDYVEIIFNEEVMNMAFLLYLNILIQLGVLFTILYCVKNRKTVFRYEKTPHLTSKGNLFATICFSPTIIVFYVFALISILEAQLVP